MRLWRCSDQRSNRWALVWFITPRWILISTAFATIRDSKKCWPLLSYDWGPQAEVELESRWGEKIYFPSLFTGADMPPMISHASPLRIQVCVILVVSVLVTSPVSAFVQFI